MHTASTDPLQHHPEPPCEHMLGHPWPPLRPLRLQTYASFSHAVISLNYYTTPAQKPGIYCSEIIHYTYLIVALQLSFYHLLGSHAPIVFARMFALGGGGAFHLDPCHLHLHPESPERGLQGSCVGRCARVCAHQRPPSKQQRTGTS